MMGMTVGLLFLLVLGSSLAFAYARSLSISDFSVMQIMYEKPESEIQNLNVQNDKLCAYCEQFSQQALHYLKENKSQSEIIATLHHACSEWHYFREECGTLVDYYAPLFFMEIETIHPDNFCKKVNLCENAALVSTLRNKNTCTLCHEAVVEVLMKLKDPDTQLEIIELLLKGCDRVQSFVKECKKLVFDYGPIVLANAEQFLENYDICTTIHACKSSNVPAETDSALIELPSSG